MSAWNWSKVPLRLRAHPGATLCEILTVSEVASPAQAMESSGMSFKRVSRSAREEDMSKGQLAMSHHASTRVGQVVMARPRGAGLRHIVLTTTTCCLLCALAVTQQSQPSPTSDAPSSSVQSRTTRQGNNPVQSSMSFLQRKSVFFPDLATNTGPLDRWQKFKLAANNSVSLATVSAALLGAAYGQTINSPARYHQGGEGYAKRFGADMARSASANLFGTFLIASALHEDPRFYVRRSLSFKESLKYAAVRVAVTRSDRGNRVVNFAGLLGPLAGEGLANTYYPEGNRGVSSTFIRYGADLGWKFGGHMLRQYWPSINRRLRLVPDTPPAPAPTEP